MRGVALYIARWSCSLAASAATVTGAGISSSFRETSPAAVLFPEWRNLNIRISGPAFADVMILLVRRWSMSVESRAVIDGASVSVSQASRGFADAEKVKKRRAGSRKIPAQMLDGWRVIMLFFQCDEPLYDTMKLRRVRLESAGFNVRKEIAYRALQHGKP